jgi:NTE family protein
VSETGYGFNPYLPLPPDRRGGVALCLSGGGYRAALFHLGALRRLDELGVLSQVDTIASVSGGSIMAAHVAAHVVRRPEAWSDGRASVIGFESEIAAPMRKLSGTNVRTRAVLERAKPKRWLDANAQIDVLDRELEESGVRGTLADLPPRPRFVFCATDIVFRGGWTFDSGNGRLGGPEPGYGAASGWRISRAAAASTCVPLAFAPLRPGLTPTDLSGGSYREHDRGLLVSNLELVDGGLYDNLALEPVWRDHRTVLVSDAAPSFIPLPQLGRLWRSLRLAVVLLEQATELRKRWLISGFLRGDLEGTYWGIASEPTHYPYRPPIGPYDSGLIRDPISQVRIDLDVFSEGERAVLETHGYLMAEIAVRSHAAGLIRHDAELRLPYGDEWLDRRRVLSALRGSDRTKLFARR